MSSATTVLGNHTARFDYFLEDLVLFEIATGRQRAGPLTVASPLNCLTVTLDGLKLITLAHIYDAGPIALITLLPYAVLADPFLNVRSVHQFWGANITFSILTVVICRLNRSV